MNALAVVAIAIAVLVLAYLLYGRWLARRWGVDPNKPTPASEHADGVDYDAAPAHVLFGHHFASIAGAGVVFGPIQAALFGWVPVVLWVLVGGIFFGAAHDFGSLFASIRHKGETLAAVVRDNMDNTAKRLFCVFAYLLCVLLIAALTSIVAGSFQVTELQDPAQNSLNSTVALASAFFVLAAVVWGFVTHGRRIPVVASVLCGIAVAAIVVAGALNLPDVLNLGYEVWVVVLGVYVLAASIAPVWVLLRPRDYLSSYLFYGTMVVALVGVVGSAVSGATGDLQIPAFTGFVVNTQAFDAASGTVLVDGSGAPMVNQVAQGGFLFPVLFVTLAGGALSGFHGLVASGTTSKQIANERHAAPVAFGGMLLASLLAILSLCAVGFVWTGYTAGAYTSPMQVFADGLSGMLAIIPGLEETKSVAYVLITLCASALCLTALDSAVRVARYVFQELWVPVGKSAEDLDSWRKVLASGPVAAVITVALGVGLGFSGYAVVWPLFGAANQLLAALALLAVSAWLANAGKDNKMLFVPMVLALVVALCSLLLTMQQKVVALMIGGSAVAPAIQLVVAVALFVLALVLVSKGWKAAFGNKERQ